MIENSTQEDIHFVKAKDFKAFDAKKIFRELFKKHRKWFVLSITISIVWTIFCIVYLFKGNFFLENENNIFIISAPWLLVSGWLIFISMKAREAFWKQLALMYKGEYVSKIRVSNEKGLLFNVGHSQFINYGIKTIYNNHPLFFFEYMYVIGSGKTRQVYNLTVFRIKFTGTFPHIYLNYKNDWYSNTPSVFASLANISTPKEFQDKFKLYSPKEYEIETLQIFTPEIFQLFIDSDLDYDIELVESEIIFYKRRIFSSSVEFDTELLKMKKLVDILSIRLDKTSFYKIGDIPFNF